MVKKRVIVATDDLLLKNDAKTAHGLIRGSDRFEVLAVIDEKSAGLDAGESLDRIHRNIPVISSVQKATNTFKTIDYLVFGVATVGGILSDSLLLVIHQAISEGLGIVNDLHDQLGERENLVISDILEP